MKVNLDKIGSVVSSVCVVHCVLLPVIISSLPFVAIYFSHSLDIIELILLSLAFVFGISASCFGFAKHKKWPPVIFISMGLFTALFTKIFSHNHAGHNHFHSHGSEANHVLFMIFAGVMLVTGHIINNKLCHKFCNKCHNESCDN